MATITTQACMVCGKTSEMDLTDGEVAALQAGEMVQNALSTRSADERELVISGTHGTCWDELFGE